jgi:hypothetical protein
MTAEDDLSDEVLVAGFESTALPAERFTHAAHVRVAWYYLRSLPVLEAVARFAAGIWRFANSKGATTKYHETITIAYLLIIHERLDGARSLTWESFADRNPDLFDRALLSRYYSDRLLTSERARDAFVLPDRLDEPARAVATSST